MVKVGNQGLDDRYIRLRSHRISHPVVSGLRQSHSIPGGGGTPIHYLYGYVPPNGVVILKLLI